MEIKLQEVYHSLHYQENVIQQQAAFISTLQSQLSDTQSSLNRQLDRVAELEQLQVLCPGHG